MTRQEANRKIVELLGVLVEAYPSVRFSQLMLNAGVVVFEGSGKISPLVWTDEFYLESDVLLERVLGAVAEWHTLIANTGGAN